MSLLQHLLIVIVLIMAAGFLSLSEIALAGARKIKLKLMAEAGEERALAVMTLQAQSADFFAASQIGLNAVAILGGILGEGAVRPYFIDWIARVYDGPGTENIGFVLSFTLITSLFVLFADLMPKRLAMTAPEKIAIVLIRPITLYIRLCKPLARVLNGIANLLFRLFNVDTAREDNITFDDISAVVEAGAQAGVLQKREQHFIENVFALESRTVNSCMTARDNVVFFSLKEAENSIRQKIAHNPYSKFLVCDEVIDHVVGYVDTRDILVRLLNQQTVFQLNESSIRTVLLIPDTLTLSELLDRFRSSEEKFAVVINEYALVMGVITLSDIMITVMGSWGGSVDDTTQIVQRDERSWLIDGGTAIEDLKRTLGIDELPDEENYETAAGFIMFMLRKVPRPTDFAEYQHFRFEVVDVDHYRIDKLLVTRLDTDALAAATAPPP